MGLIMLTTSGNDKILSLLEIDGGKNIVKYTLKTETFSNKNSSLVVEITFTEGDQDAYNKISNNFGLF